MPTHDDLHQAIMRDDDDLVRDIVQQDPALATADGTESPILTALYRGRHTPLRYLLEARPALTADEAAALGNVRALRAWLERDPDLVRRYALDGYTLLHRAAWFGHPEACTLLLNRGADPAAISHNDAEHDALHAAVGGRHPEVATLLLDRGADIDARQSHGFTPLHLAAVLGETRLVRLLLDRGADPTIEAEDGRTPAALAYLAEHDEVAQLLWERER